MKKKHFPVIGLMFITMLGSVYAQDTINNFPFATHIDTLIASPVYINRAIFSWDDVSSWEIIWIDDTVRASVKNGDILRVIFKDDSTKDYVFQVEEYQAGNNALLSTITWPDIPLELQNKGAWKGDTLPGFMPDRSFYEGFDSFWLDSHLYWVVHYYYCCSWDAPIHESVL